MPVALIVLVAVAVVVPIAGSIPRFKCGGDTYPGCYPGQYNCCSWTGYLCTSGGTSLSKKGEIFAWNACITGDPNDNCELDEVVCQKDIYYKQSGCSLYCNEYAHYVTGCYINKPTGVDE